MTLKIVNNNLLKEIHLVSIDDGSIEVTKIEDGSKVNIDDMETEFNGFQSVIENATDTFDVLTGLSQLNHNYIWAHVSGKI